MEFEIANSRKGVDKLPLGIGFENVRKKPDLDSEILGTKPAGTVVRALGVEEGWLHLIDGSYILFEEGKYAEKVVL